MLLLRQLSIAICFVLATGSISVAQLLPEVRCMMNPAEGFAQMYNAEYRVALMYERNRQYGKLNNKVEELNKLRLKFKRALASTNAFTLKNKSPLFLSLDTDCLEDFFLFFYNAHVKVDGNRPKNDNAAATYRIVDKRTGKSLFWDVDGNTIFLNTYMKDSGLMDLLMTKEEVAREIIEDEVSRYSGSCPCPFNQDINGATCGARSAYSRKGGASPRCYVGDFTEEELLRIRRRTLLLPLD